MDEEYNKDTLYLYQNDWADYVIGTIKKVNEKSIKMQQDVKIQKKDFNNKVYKLTDEEISKYKNELITKLSGAAYKIQPMLNLLDKTKLALDYSEFTCIDAIKLQKQIDILTKSLEEELPKILTINNKTFEVSQNRSNLNEVEKR